MSKPTLVVVLLSLLGAQGCYRTFVALDDTDAGADPVSPDAASPDPTVDAGHVDAAQVAVDSSCVAPGEAATTTEIAARMARLLWDSPPDDALLSRSDLATAAARESEARRMLRDPRAGRGISRIARTWLQIDAPPSGSADAATLELLRTETSRFVQEVVLRGDGRLSTVLLADWSIRQREVAAWYGAMAPEDWSRVSIATEPRRGVLMHGALVAERTTPVSRGLFVRTELLCNEVPPPPPDVEPVLPPDGMMDTRRERYEQHMSDPACAGCHRLIDPIGFAFEGFGVDGSARTTDDGFPIDDSGELVETDVDGAFLGPIELAARLSESDQVRECVTQRWLEQALGREADECTFAHAHGAFAASGFDLNELLVAIASSPGMSRR
ncbi:MAG: DUF1588 domain-containing protein [Myxococcota bacterium]|nr:DUF1588 domain-containing protein [Myxococcota bacterium]